MLTLLLVPFFLSRDIAWRFILLALWLLRLTSSVTANMVKDVAASNVFDYFSQSGFGYDSAPHRAGKEHQSPYKNKNLKIQMISNKQIPSAKIQIPNEKVWEVDMFGSLIN